MMDYKCGSNEGEGVDRISQLPDGVIVDILSLLPLVNAAATSVLSTRWLDLWRHTPYLNFELGSMEYIEWWRHTWSMLKPKYIKWVNSVLESHKSHHLKEVTIPYPLRKSDHCTLTKWLEFVFSRRVEVLELNFVGNYQDENYVVLEDVLRGSSISKSTNLTSLYLSALKMSGEAMGLLLRNCPLLERLIINGVVFTSNIIEVRSCVLKHLEIEGSSGESIQIKIYAPNLTFLRIDGIDNDDGDYLENCFIIDAPNLVSACLRNNVELELELIRSISSQLTTLECNLRCFEVFFKEGLFPQMPKLRELIVTYYGKANQPITTLLFAVPYLEVFEIKFFTTDWIQRQGVENVGRFCHIHLKVFMFSNFDVDDCGHMNLMSYILDNCVALQKIIVQVAYTYEAAKRLVQTEQPSDIEIYEAICKNAKQLLQSKVPTHIELIVEY